jgi:AraC family transcriptional regulator
MMTSISNVSLATMKSSAKAAPGASTGIRHFEQPRLQPEFKLRPQCERGSFSPTVQISPVDSVKRLGTGWQGWFTESIYAPIGNKVEFRFHGPAHLLVMYNEGRRRDGETSVEGVPSSRIRNVANKLTFVPVGHAYREWLETAASTRVTLLYLQPSQFQNGIDISDVPRIHFEDAAIWATAAKLKRAIESGQTKSAPYLAALSNVLALELSRAEHDTAPVSSAHRGGLASWQKRAVADYIEQHLGDQICLAMLARLVRLSQHHFCRAFKLSFGIPPHQYHVQRRIEHAKILLADHTESVTNIGLTVGYSQICSFSVAFRKMTGWSPSEYRREFK